MQLSVGARKQDRAECGLDTARYVDLARQRTDFGRAHSSMRLRTAQPMATSVC